MTLRPWWALLVVAGCANPCADLAEKACARAGASSEVCKQVQEVAKSPTEADLQACRAGVAFALQLEKR